MPSLLTVSLIQYFVVALLFIALLNGQRDLAVLSLLVLGLVGGLKLWTRMSLTGLVCRLTIDKRKVFPDEKISLKISAENGKLLPIWLELLIPIGGLLQRSSGARVLERKTSLLWFQRIQLEWEITAEHRGVYQIGPLYSVAGDLFSFFSRTKRSLDSYPIIVYPRLVPINSLPLPRRDFFGVPQPKSPVQDPIYILGTRDYQNGQPAKYIHWKASARHNRLQEKVFESTVQEKVLLAVDAASFAQHGAVDDWERALELVASLAVRFDHQGHAVGLVTDGMIKGGGLGSIPVTKNDQQLAAILEMLARLEIKPERDLADLIRRRLVCTWGISCVYFAYAADESVSATREYFALHKTPVVFIVSQSPSPTGERTPGLPRKVYGFADISAREVASK